ncbi:class I SAM-dependent methyltransferase [Specibacter cremeus]|uniref:class I SAM-dependent methyltransferase n=1 Tax=Specibacter cremeus TaxID=1629051 RepID=UPI000F7B33C7|nr:class I SAM-dependent methyltransferase [Specibacter cremeus]
MRQPSNEDIATTFNRIAAGYDRPMGLFERHVAVGARVWAVSKARGAVIEIGVGTGLNLPLYGLGVQHVTGVDLADGMLAIASKRLADAGVGRVELRRGDAQALDLPSESADTVVSTFTFCTIPDPHAASREAYRVLRPGGLFVLAEHGTSTRAVGRAVLRALEPLSIRFGADHLTRDPVPYLTGAGFRVTEVHRGGPGGVIFRILARKDDA